jgi:hypothetical protein
LANTTKAYGIISAVRPFGNRRGNFIEFISLLDFITLDFATGLRRNVFLRKRKTIKAEVRAVATAYIHPSLKPSGKP